MSRLALIAALSLLATASWKERRKELQSQNESQRKKLGLDDAKLYAQFPTPEVTFDGSVVELACGKTGTLHVAGQWPKGSAFLISDDDVQVVEQKASETSWQARVKAAPAAAPYDVSVHVISPATNAERAIRVAKITGKYTLDLRFEDGWTAHFADGNLAWKKGGEARETQAELAPEGNRMQLRWQRSQEEIDANQKGMEKLQSLGSEQAMQHMQACMAKAEPARSACMQDVQKEFDALGKKVQAAQEEAESRRPTAAWACNDARLDATGGAVTGVAVCAPHDRKMKVTGTLACSGE